MINHNTDYYQQKKGPFVWELAQVKKALKVQDLHGWCVRLSGRYWSAYLVKDPTICSGGKFF